MTIEPMGRVPGEEVLRLEDVSVHLDGRLIVRNVEFAVHAHEIAAIIGPSGCGKTVLVKSIVRLQELEDPTVDFRATGRIVYQGENLLEREPWYLEAIRSRIAYVAQIPVVLPLTIMENVTFGIQALAPHLKASAVLDKAVQSLEDAKLWAEVQHRLSADPQTLSPGQRQRLAIARALALDPDVLLLDEPCAFMDPINGSKIEDLLAELPSAVAVVIVTHNLQQAARVSDRCLFMLAQAQEDESTVGLLVEYDATEQIFSNPADERTENYVTGRYG
jgi:phosphate transport system ATP-binding protein